jgi:predicted nuclease of predicted toxin-antitoxin system
MRFLVDANLPPALARWLIEHGAEASHVADGGGAARTDASIWNEAVAAAAVIMTKDDDFPRRRSVARQGPQIDWIRLGNTRKAPLLAHLAAVWPGVVAALGRGEAVNEVP